MPDFGSGIFLTQDFDFEVTNTGDIRTESGVDELEKDIALQMIKEKDDLIGLPQYPNTSARISSQTREILNADPRVSQVVSVNVKFITSLNEAEITSSVTTDNGEQELVFNI